MCDMAFKSNSHTMDRCRIHVRLFTLLNIVFQLPSVLTSCGYDACNPTHHDPSVLNVHLVPHTHDDVGWLKTVDQYYMGSENSIQHAGVQYILDSVVSELLKDPSKRFIYVEVAFFERWWHEQNDETKTSVKKLVNEGRLEFINGGWCMNDEATTHYNSIIDQMTLGLRFLNDTFGSCGRPLVAWHIDPFGHSREQASIFAQMGFDGFFFARLDYADKINRLRRKEMEAIWHGSSSLGKVADLLFGALYAHYNPPPGFCYDQSCNDPPIQDDPDLFDYNVDDRVKRFINYAKLQAISFKTNHIMMTMGSDFQYENAIPWFKNMDKLIKYVNQRGDEFIKINVFYSTPSCYVKSLNEAVKTWTTKSDDFFPYADKPHSYWTGYFTSRPALKYYERVSNNFLQVCKQLEVLAGSQQHIDKTAESKSLGRAMAVAQHHDAVSGTEKQHVANDYAKRLAIGTSRCQRLVDLSLGSFMSATSPPNSSFCTYLNISVCPVTEDSKSFAVMAYNPIGRVVSQFVRVPVNGNNFLVEGPDGKPIKSEISSVSASTKAVRRNRGNATNELVFLATIPALGYNTYIVSRAKFVDKFHQAGFSKAMKEMLPSSVPVVIQNEFLKLTFDSGTGLLDSITDTKFNLMTMVKQSFYWYKSSIGTPLFNQASGAYIFRPNQSNPVPIILSKSAITNVFKGDLIQEVHQEFSPWLTQVIRLYKGQQHAEFEWTVGPIAFVDGFGKEIITRFDSDIKSGKKFYTDSNGREILERIRSESFLYNVTEPVAGNYYPVNSRMYLKDEKRQLTILSDRSQGGSSMQEGSMELMIHRRILRDDDRGVGEPLNETGQFGDGLIIRGKHFVLLSPPNKAASLHRDLGEKLYMAPSLSFSEASADWPKKYKLNGSMLHSDLHPNIHLLTLELWNSNTALIRLEHQYEKGEDPNLSQNVTVSLKNLFVPFDVVSVKEVTLSANQYMEDAKRLQWKVTGSDQLTPSNKKPMPVPSDTLDVLLTPMQIRSFLAIIKRHN